jgi:hypothetical protein
VATDASPSVAAETPLPTSEARSTIAERLAAVRSAVTEIQGELRPEGLPAPPQDTTKLTQWYNWPNWGNFFNNWNRPWYNFNNWGNW